MFNNIITSKSFHFFVAIIVAILTTGFLRLQLLSGAPETDGGFYTFTNQYFYYLLSNGEDLKKFPLFLYQFMTSWVFGFEVNQFILLRLIDLLVAVTASFIFFKVILKESGSTLFSVITASALFIGMNNIEIIGYGYMNSIWAAYLPLFTALLVWQKSSKEDTFSFYVIGALVSLGVLLREPFLPFFLLAGVAIFIGYGWRVLHRYLIGSAILGFSVIAFLLMFRGWDLLDLTNTYTNGFFLAGTANWIWDIPAGREKVLRYAIGTIKSNWFIFVIALASIIYLIKVYLSDKKSVNMNRFYFWLAIGLLPLLEWFFKYGLPYHLANCLPGLLGLSAMSWRYINNNESKRINTSSLLVLGLMSLFVILPTINHKIIQSSYIYTPKDAIYQAGNLSIFRTKDSIARNQFLIAAAKIYGLSREDSTLAVNGFWQPLYPLTNLLPPIIELSSLRALFIHLDYNEDKLIKVLEEHRPTLIFLSPPNLTDRTNFSSMVEKTNLYNKVGVVPENLKISKGYLHGVIYRLKDFK
jgi:hypothetical protein